MQEEVLTVRKRLEKMNKDFQDIQLFKPGVIGILQRTVPLQLKAIKEFMISKVSHNEALLQCVKEECTTIIEEEIDEIKKVEETRKFFEDGKPVSDDLRLSYLNNTKKYVDISIQQFFKCCRLHEVSILSQDEI